MKTTNVSFDYTHLGVEYVVDASFRQCESPGLSMHGETGYEGEWELVDIDAIGPDGESWYSEMENIFFWELSRRPLYGKHVSIASLILKQAYGEIE